MIKMPILLLLILFSSCLQNHKSNNIALCDKNTYFNELNEYSKSFKPTNLNLENSIKDNQELDTFIDTIDNKCLENQSQYKVFISTILLKQYYFQLSNYNQSYDLLSMKTGSAEKIINGFIGFSKVDKNIEMLSSSYVFEYLKHNPKITNSEIEKYKSLLDKLTN